MKRSVLVGLFLVVVFTVAPAAANASLVWEVKGPPATFTELTKATSETLKSSGSLMITGQATSKPFKGTCKLTDEERIENPPGATEGIDEMLTFVAKCNSGKSLPPTPCAIGESYELRGHKLPWFSELTFPSFDTFENVELELECLTSTATAFYHPPGHVWNPKLSVNALKTSSASGIFKLSPGNWFYLTGTDKLTPTAHLEVQ